MNVARLNFSHGTHEDHAKLLKTVREESAKLKAHVAVIQDLCGPKVRIGEIKDGQVVLDEGKKIALRHADGSVGDAENIYVEAFDPAKVLQAGRHVLLGDGQIQLHVDDIANDCATCTVSAGGSLRSRVGISVPETRLNLPSLTEKDIHDITWAAEHAPDYVALSFVRSRQDIEDLKGHLEGHGVNIPIIAKIERASSLDNISEIVNSCDAVMVARGDLGLQLPLQCVPGAQRLIIAEANAAGIPVIIATEMLQSMVKQARPTRAEVSDISTAVHDGADAVMLSEETALGAHPIEAVTALDIISREAESELEFGPSGLHSRGAVGDSVPDAIAYAACNAADKINAAAILACTESGYSARLVAKYRPLQALFGITSEERPLRRMALYRGVQPLYCDVTSETALEAEVLHAMAAVRDEFGLKPGSRVVLTSGLNAKKTGTTSVMEIREIPRS